MDATEAKVRCLELAATVGRARAEHSTEAIVKTATALYAFVNASEAGYSQPQPADKPRRGRPPKVDILD